jgi:hypothetical protein
MVLDETGVVEGVVDEDDDPPHDPASAAHV